MKNAGADLLEFMQLKGSTIFVGKQQCVLDSIKSNNSCRPHELLLVKGYGFLRGSQGTNRRPLNRGKEVDYCIWFIH